MDDLISVSDEKDLGVLTVLSGNWSICGQTKLQAVTLVNSWLVLKWSAGG